MTLTMYFFAFSCIVVCVYYVWTRRRYYKVAYELPGPIGWPFIGIGFEMMNPESFLQYLKKASKKYKTPFVSWMGTKCFLYVNDPETAETIFNSPHCTNKGDFYRFMATAIGDGLFTSSSPRWNKHRRLINPAFSRQTIKNFLNIFNAEADTLLDILKDDGVEQHNKLEIYELIKKSVLEAACQTTMGKKMNFQNDGSKLIFDSYNSITEVCVKRMLSPWLYPDIIYKRSSLFSRQQQVVNVLFRFVENLLQAGSQSISQTNKRVARKSDGASVGNGDGDVNDNVSVRKSKSIFIEQVRNHIEQGNLTWEDVRDEANVIVAATFETTSTALYLVCLLLALNPECQDKLYDELSAIFPNRMENKNLEGSCKYTYEQVTNEQLERMTYAEMVINEAMRLFAPVPIVLRSASEDFHLRNGISIPRGTQIGIDIFNMQRNVDIWGEYALEFRPEEHFGALAKSRHSFSFIPFTKGLRMCIGYRYALMLMKVVLAKIFLYYRLSTDAKMSELIVKGTISIKLREYPLCNVARRERYEKC